MKTVMLVDDSHVDQTLFRRILLRSGLVDDVLSFSMAQDAFDYLKLEDTPSPDLILLDINMPVLDGFDLLELLEADFGTGLLPIVVMLTTSLDPRDKARADSFLSVREFIHKPLTEQHLRRLLGPTPEAAPVAARQSTVRPAAHR